MAKLKYNCPQKYGRGACTSEYGTCTRKVTYIPASHMNPLLALQTSVFHKKLILGLRYAQSRSVLIEISAFAHQRSNRVINTARNIP